VHKLYFVLAIIWTLLIITTSLISLDNAPSVRIVGIDKLVHGLFYFIFVLLWIIALEEKYKLVIVGIALFLGGIIEFLQGIMEQHRSADWYDFLANSIGVALAFILSKKIILLLKRFHLYN
jgi:VanZ family protein